MYGFLSILYLIFFGYFFLQATLIGKLVLAMQQHPQILVEGKDPFHHAHKFTSRKIFTIIFLTGTWGHGTTPPPPPPPCFKKLKKKNPFFFFYFF